MHAPPTPSSRVSAARRVGRALRSAAIVAFVVWHLFFLVFRGMLDLNYERYTGRLRALPGWGSVDPAFGAVDRATWRYGALLGIEQGWSLFSGMSREAAFPAGRLEFADGSSEWVLSENEPTPDAFVRFGGWRLRKLEDYLAATDAIKLASSPERELWGAYARRCAWRWRAHHPNDPRAAVQTVLVARTLAFPAPGDDPCTRSEPAVAVLGTFHPDGRPR